MSSASGNIFAEDYRFDSYAAFWVRLIFTVTGNKTNKHMVLI